MHDKELETLRQLAEGRDPISGHPLDSASPYRQPRVRQAIERAIALIERSLRDDRPARSGMPWTDEEIRRLAARHAAGEAPETIAAALERTTTAIVARLVQLQLMAPPPGFRLRYESRPATVD